MITLIGLELGNKEIKKHRDILGDRIRFSWFTGYRHQNKERNQGVFPASPLNIWVPGGNAIIWGGEKVGNQQVTFRCDESELPVTFQMGLASSSWGNEPITSRKSLGLRHKPVSQQHNNNKITWKNSADTILLREKESNPRINPNEFHYGWLKGRKIAKKKTAKVG